MGSCTPRHSGIHAPREWQVAAVEVEQREASGFRVGRCKRQDNPSVSCLALAAACARKSKAVEDRLATPRTFLHHLDHFAEKRLLAGPGWVHPAV